MTRKRSLTECSGSGGRVYFSNPQMLSVIKPQRAQLSGGKKKKKCFQTGFIPFPKNPKDFLGKPQPLKIPPVNPETIPLTPRAFHIKRAASHQFSKYKLWDHTVWALKSHVRAWLRSVSHNYRVALVAGRAAAHLGNQPGEEENDGVYMPASRTSINTKKCKGTVRCSHMKTTACGKRAVRRCFY